MFAILRSFFQSTHFHSFFILYISIGTVLQVCVAQYANSSEYFYYDGDEDVQLNEIGRNLSNPKFNSANYFYYSEEVVDSDLSENRSLYADSIIEETRQYKDEVIRTIGNSLENQILPPTNPLEEPLQDSVAQEGQHHVAFEGEPYQGPLFTDTNYGNAVEILHHPPGGIVGAPLPLSGPPVSGHIVGPGSPLMGLGGPPLLPHPLVPYHEPVHHTPFHQGPLHQEPFHHGPLHEEPFHHGPPAIDSFPNPIEPEYLKSLEYEDDHNDDHGSGPINHQHNDHVEVAHHGWKPTKNPVVAAKEFFTNLLDTLSDITKQDLVVWVDKFFDLIAEFTIPKEHYLRVISFAGVYLFIALLIYGSENIADIRCEIDNKGKPAREFTFQVGRRFVPAQPVDPRMQNHFINLFRGIDEYDFDSSEEEYYTELQLRQIGDMCPRDSFFFSLNPSHIEAYTTLQRIFVAQKSPVDVLHAARGLLRSEFIHPKVWYFGIVGASFERPDMTGFSIAHPVDAIPDWYIPAHLIDDVMRKYRRLPIIKRIGTVGNDTDKEIRKRTHILQTTTSKNSTKISKRIKRMASLENIAEIINVNIAMKHNQTTSGILRRIGLIKHDGNVTNISNTTTKTISSTTTTPGPILGKEKGENGDLATYTTSYEKGINPYIYSHYQYDDEDTQKRRKKKKGKKKKGKNKGKRKKKKKHEEDYDDCIIVDGRVGIDNGIENELWYFREDMMVNQHHWYWHQTHPPNATVHPDRRAELFFYMHRAFLARYNAERLSNGLARIAPMHFRPGAVIYEGYNSHLADINTETYWTPRYPMTLLSDVFHDNDPDFARNITLAGFLKIYKRLVKSVKFGKMYTTKGKLIPIDHFRGIEPLSNTVEATELSVNPQYYDSIGIHTLGHFLVGLASDPDYRFQKVTGVMSEAALSMRDPSFYTYHLFMDDFFEMYKKRLAPYKIIGGDFPLLWKGVEIVKVELRSQKGGTKNELRTFWTHHKFPLSPGVDRSIDDGDEQEKVCAQHLDHEPFKFKIVIDRKPCTKSKSGKGTIRIFMAPRYDEKGRRIALKDQRRLMFPLDAFPVKLKVGRNIITRYSEDSALTHPWTKSIGQYERGPDASGAAEFCGCGWPQHLYIPKGHIKGQAFDLFVMVTNFDDDHVPNESKILKLPETCNSPYIFCGLPRRKYPDAKPMGYPFDRPLFKSLDCPPGYSFAAIVCKSVNLLINRPMDTLEEYVSRAPNIASLKFIIRHLDIFLPEPSRHR